VWIANALLFVFGSRLRKRAGRAIGALSDDWLQDMYWLVLMDGEHERRRKENEGRSKRRRFRSGRAFAFEDDDLDG